MRRYRDQNLANVVGIIRLRQLVAHLLSIGVDFLQEAARFVGRGRERRVHSDADDVVSGWHNRLAITAIKNEILSTQEETVRVSPAMADALVAGNADRAAISKLRTPRRLGAVSGGNWIGIQHAEPLLGCLPDKSCGRLAQLIQRVMPGLVMMVECCKFEQHIVA